MGILTAKQGRIQVRPTLELDSSEPAPAGHRLLKFLLRESLAEGATELWLIPQEHRLLVLHKVGSDWYRLLNPVSFHQRQIINALRGLGDVNAAGEGCLTLETAGDGVQCWDLTLSPGSRGEEAFLTLR